MSWHYLPEQAADYTEACCSDTLPSALLNSYPITATCCCSDSATACSHASPCGMTFAPLTEQHGADVLTWFLAGFPVKTFQQPEKAQASTANEADSGAKWRGSFAKYSPDSRLWKTAQCSLLADSDVFSETWPRWGLMRDGGCSEETTLALITAAPEFGFWPTPTSGPRDASCTMRTALKWTGIAQRDSLSFAVARREAEEGRHSPNGQVNPEFAEWLMGWPTGATALSGLETDKFPEWLQQHGECLEAHERLHPLRNQ